MNKKRTASGLSLLVLALPLSACGGGSSSSTSLPEVTGRAIDGYLANSKVFLSSNPDVFVRTSDAVGSQGSFEGLFGTGSIVVREGVDISTGKTFTGELKAPEGSKVVTPITTIVEAVVSQAAASGNTSVTPAVAAQQVAKGLGLQSTSDILNVDFVESGSAGMAKAAAKVASVISVVTASTGDEVSAAVLGNIAAKVAKAGEVGGKTNVLNDAAELKNVFQEVRTNQAELFEKQPETLNLDVLIDNVANVVAKVSAQVDAAASLKDIAATQQAVQDDIVVAFTVDAENPEAFDPTVFEAALAEIDEGFDAIIAEAVLELDTYIATVDTGLDFEVVLDAADLDETVVAIDLDIIDGALEGTIPDELITGFVFGEVELETLDGVLDGTIDAAAVEEILATLPEFDIFPEDPAGEVPGEIPDGELPDDLPEDIADLIGGSGSGGSGSGTGTSTDTGSSISLEGAVVVTAADSIQSKLDTAIAAASSGETVVLSLAAGRYDQDLTIDTGSTGVKVVIAGNQFGNALLNNSAITNNTLDALDISESSDLTALKSSIVFDSNGGRASGESWINGKITVKSDDVTLDGLRLHSYNGAIDFVNDSDARGIENFVLQNSYVTGFEGGKGFEHQGKGADAGDVNWTITGNLIGGVAGGVGGSFYLDDINGVSIEDNVFWRPGAAHMYLTNTTNMNVEDNFFYHGVHADGANFDGLLGQLVSADDNGEGYVGFSGGSGYGYGFGYGYGADSSNITKMGYGYGGYGGGYGYGPSGYLPPNADAYGLDAYGGSGDKENEFLYYGRNYIAEIKGDSTLINFSDNWGYNNSGGIQIWDEGDNTINMSDIFISGNQMAGFINADQDGLLATLSSRHKSGLVGGVVSQTSKSVSDTYSSFASEDGGLYIFGNTIIGDLSQILNDNDLDALIEVGGGAEEVYIAGNNLTWTGTKATSNNLSDNSDGWTQGILLYGDLYSPFIAGNNFDTSATSHASAIRLVADLSGSALSTLGQLSSDVVLIDDVDGTISDYLTDTGVFGNKYATNSTTNNLYALDSGNPAVYTADDPTSLADIDADADEDVWYFESDEVLLTAELYGATIPSSGANVFGFTVLEGQEAYGQIIAAADTV